MKADITAGVRARSYVRFYVRSNVRLYVRSNVRSNVRSLELRSEPEHNRTARNDSDAIRLAPLIIQQVLTRGGEQQAVRDVERERTAEARGAGVFHPIRPQRVAAEKSSVTACGDPRLCQRESIVIDPV